MSLARRVVLSSVRTQTQPWRRLYSSTELDARKGDRQRLVVIGSGWAGFGVLRGVDKKKYQTVVISPRSYFAFTPLLASTAVGTLEFRTAIEPVRRKGVELYQGWAETVDFKDKSILVQSNLATELDKDQGGEKFTVKYDKVTFLSTTTSSNSLSLFQLVIAPGAYSQTFGTPGVTQHAYFLKDVADARRIRQRVLSNFEKAALPTTSPAERDKLLHFAIVGGGATGVEFAAELHDLLHDDLPELYPTQGTRSLVEEHARITIYDVAPRILGMFDTALGEFAERHLKREGVSIRPNHVVERVESGMLHFKGGEAVPFGMLVWATGLATNPFVKSLKGIEKEPAHQARILTDAKLRVLKEGGEAIEDVFALGDCAAVKDGPVLPTTAQVASQKANYLVKHFNSGDPDRTTDFVFKNFGALAYLGGWRAIMQGESQNIKGWAAWVIWRGAYLTKSVSWRNKILIPTLWMINWLFGRDISRF
ncbi:Pyridine nucleotide-disulfide oxidoreductase [Rhizoctonia solani]|uniref:Pyridine nucleotide-disulfide oxidoreductase n=1 Tax=Rhizoctonia solani TaxID=456999 RepID=A0A8H7HEM1_9AGAM|nr:Pyridine nucleotide-disulfide oxidoreductase [Rhizoctonia solani]